HPVDSSDKMYRRLSNQPAEARLMSRSVTTESFGYEASAGWTTYGTWRANFHSFRASPRDAQASLAYFICQIQYEPACYPKRRSRLRRSASEPCVRVSISHGSSVIGSLSLIPATISLAAVVAGL